MTRKTIEILAVLGCVLILGACSDKGTDSDDDKAAGYYVYAQGYWSSPRNYGIIYKIDADVDSVVDSTRYPNDLLFLHTTPDGKELWGMGPQMTVVWNTTDMSEKRRIEGLGAFEPIFETDTGYYVLAGIEKQTIYFMDILTGDIVDSDTMIGIRPWAYALGLRGTHNLIGMNEGTPKYIYFYEYFQRLVRDSVLLTDFSGGISSGDLPVLSPDGSQLHMYGGRHGPFHLWRVFELETGRLIHEQSVWTRGSFTFVEDGRKVIVSSPGDCQDLPSSEILPIFDVGSFALVDSIGLRSDSLNMLPGGILPAYQGVGLPGTSKAFIGCGYFCNVGPMLVVQTDPPRISRYLFLSPHVGFEAITIGRK